MIINNFLTFCNSNILYKFYLFAHNMLPSIWKGMENLGGICQKDVLRPTEIFRFIGNFMFSSSNFNHAFYVSKQNT